MRLQDVQIPGRVLRFELRFGAAAISGSEYTRNLHKQSSPYLAFHQESVFERLLVFFRDAAWISDRYDPGEYR